MARIAKTGLEYFPLDVDFFQDIRIRKLIKRQGGKAITVYTLLLCIIYKHGYYIQWDTELPFIGSEMSGFEQTYILEVIKTCLSLGLFDKNLFESEQVLTSKAIQTRYCNIQRLNRRINRLDRYNLIENDTPENLEPSPEPEKKAQKAPKKQNSRPRKSKTEPVPDNPDNPAPLQVADSPQMPPPAPPQAADSHAQWLERFFDESNTASLHLLCKNFGFGKPDKLRLRTLADAVVAEWTISHTRHHDYSDWSRHLISTMRIKNRESSAATTSAHQKTEAPAQCEYGGSFGSIDN